MDILEYLDKLKEKVKRYDKNAKNPFLEPRTGTNPFGTADSTFRENFPQTYVWVEQDEDEA